MTEDYSMVSRLIVDMILGGATESEFKRIINYSMAVTDADENQLVLEQSYKDNNVDELKEKYQRKEKKND